MGEAAVLPSLVIILVQEQLSFIRRKNNFFSSKWIPFTGGTSCDMELLDWI
jgi:hypothetical protein